MYSIINSILAKFIFVIMASAFSATALSGESRAILDERFNWLTKADIDTTLARIKQAGFNVYIPCVWHGRGATWPTELAPKEPLWVKMYKANFDPLTYLLSRAKQMGIEVHPWFTVAVRQSHMNTEFAGKGVPNKAYNVHLPAFRQYIVKLMLEVVEKYNVDGINLDYVRSMGVCVSEYCINDYMKRHNRALREDVKEMDIDRWGLAAQTISLWNARAIGEIVKNISIQAKKLKPELIISVDTVAGLREFELQGANGVEWANKGWVDVVYHMDYQPQNRQINKVFLERGYKGLDDPDKLVLLTGNFSVRNKEVISRDESSVMDSLKYSRSLRPNGNGVALYQYHFLTDSQINKLSSGIFKTAVGTDWKVKR